MASLIMSMDVLLNERIERKMNSLNTQPHHAQHHAIMIPGVVELSESERMMVKWLLDVWLLLCVAALAGLLLLLLRAVYFVGVS